MKGVELLGTGVDAFAALNSRSLLPANLPPSASSPTLLHLTLPHTRTILFYSTHSHRLTRLPPKSDKIELEKRAEWS